MKTDKKKNKPKTIRQRGTLSGSKTKRTEQVAIDKIRSENAELKDAVKRRSEELESKNKELEIESSLERVRAIALGMRKSDDLLNICKILFNELKTLGFDELRNTMINIHNDEEETFLNYDYSDTLGKTITPLYFDINPIIKKQIKQIRKSKDSFSETSFKGDELKEWKKFRKKKGEPDDPRMKNCKALHYYFYSIGTGSIGISTFNPISIEKLQLLKRFRNVFDFAYRRYMDVSKAEAQAREAQTEAALERVRSRTMAMHNSEDVGETVVTMFEELNKLGIKPFRCGIGIFQDNYKMEVWSARSAADNKISIVIGNMEMSTHPLLQGAYDGWKKGNTSFNYELKGRDVIRYFNVINKLPEYPIKYDTSKLPSEILHHDFYFPEGTLFVFTLEPLSSETILIFNRFAAVFGQTYRRYLDLLKAEAQAREAQIEAALERVRSRTMGMQKSEELKEVIQVVYEQFVHLNIHVEHTGFIMDYKERDDMHIWLADQHEVPSQVTIPYFDSAHWNSFIEAKEKGMDFFANHLNFEEKNKFYEDLFKLIPGVPEETQEYYFSCPGLAISTVLLENVGLYIENFSGIPYTDEENNTLMRFGKVFQQTYTRFKDLKQAEAQAREAQIEAALEKVRGKAMAMHNSSDLADAAGTVFTELNKLGIKPIRSGFVLLTKDSRKAKLYPATSFDNKNTISFTGEFEFTGHPVYEKQYESWKKKENYFPVIGRQSLKSYYKILSKGLSVPYENFPTNKKQFGTFSSFH